MWNDIDSFKSELIYALEARVEPGYVVRTDNVIKNNNITKTGISLQRGTNAVEITPTIYVEDIYEHYRGGFVSMETITEDVYSNLVSLPEIDDLSEYMTPEFINEHVQVKVISGNMNRSYLIDKPFIPVEGYDDLVAVAIVDLEQTPFQSKTNYSGSFVVSDALIEHLGIRKSELFEKALSNSEQNNPAKFVTMRDVLKESLISNGISEDDPMMEMMLPPEDIGPEMYVLSNKKMVFGASSIMYNGIMQEIYNKIGGDFIIIPSSIHEVIIIKDTDPSENSYISGMIGEINENIVNDSEVLSNNFYKYNGAENTVITIKASDLGAENSIGAEL